MPTGSFDLSIEDLACLLTPGDGFAYYGKIFIQHLFSYVSRVAQMITF